ncbi:isocitrate lyase/PEP mutase family protein [Alkalicella caledoniensis]|uniref:2-methylisocitrate lyase n=1 Tax=Alkalicella caledoniensis TaxID=2731377 RepID=A0A7G9WB36_ALKCA|nr:isocitrate lyase/PEP mutase family protein [Alkalicella caledoniensis]QNO15898.1 isocitrate lyase/PEP mutase family protein [Alkalicella caledoniensis]
MKKTTKLRELLKVKEILVAPGAHDALTARVIEKSGFKTVYMTGYGQAASALGKPDIGLLSMTEMLDRARKMVSAVDVPVIADADTGFGNAITVMRTVEEYEMAGVAGIQLEDQVAPKRCGHMLGRKVVSLDEMVGKIKAAKEARKDPDFVIIARTDARTVHGIEEAVKRAKAYEEAGADVIFVESLETLEEMQLIHETLTVPTLANMVEGGRTPLLTNDELEEIGYGLVIYPTASTYVYAKAMLDLMNKLKTDKTTANYTDQMITFPEFNKLVGLEDYAKLEDKFVRE